MTRKVLLPRGIDERFDNLTGLTEDLDGILLYKRRGDDCSIEALFITGVGSKDYVQAQPERMKVADEFLRRNPDYQCIKFHTHSERTIEYLGQDYAGHFSQRDLNEIGKQLRGNRDFMAMLVTPEIKLLLGVDNPELSIVNDFSKYWTRSQAVNQSLRAIADSLGYDISRL